MKKIITILSLLTLSLLASETIIINDAFIRLVPSVSKNSAAFMNIKNLANQDDILLSASGNIAKHIELHTHKMGKKNGQMIMKMMRVPNIPLQAQNTTALKKGGYHIMLIGLNKKLKENETIPLTLHFKNAGAKIIQVPVLQK